MARFTLDPNAPPELTAAERARLEALSDSEITAGALADADNPPLSAEELRRLEAVRRVRAVRARTGLSQTRFAQAYRINVARLRDLEQGRTQADSAMMAYLTVIEREPEAVRRALAKG
ncbi:helix-turn-helix domain-containing protein [Phenylobacterium sp.]|uniref:helix-turn-helix domain-containing protein n=1 Tax=Phenylobacterium sp. TaxID=1871053 RepID=UPI002FCBC261